MATRRALTGGTGDVNPQWFTTNAVAITTTYNDVATPIPIQRLATSGRAQVMEILKAYFFPTVNTAQLNITAGTNSSGRLYITTRSNGTTEPINQATGGIIVYKGVNIASIAASVSSDIEFISEIMDLTDGAGHGLLVATDQIYIGGINSAANTPFITSSTWACRLLYRWKNVSLQEYIGIVQSQT